MRYLLLALMTPVLWGQVSFDRILNANKEPQNWLTYSGTTLSQRHSLLTQIAPGNVKNLELQWVFQAQSLEKFEATPLVVDGVLYTVQAPNDVVAMDAETGRVFWVYPYAPSPEARTCCGRVNRGLAILGDTLFMGTIDGHLVALDAKTGHPIWNVTVANGEAGYSLMHAPLVVKDKVIVGTAGGEFGIRGFLAAYDARTGKEVWKFYTIPGPGEPGHETWAGDSWMHGGASVWVTGSYDPQLNLTYWGVGNPGPDWNSDSREGANLYSDSVVALDADTGKLKWYFQFSPHDDFDYDSVQVPVLADMEWKGRDGITKLRRVMLWANRNGFYYVLDRTTGEFLQGKPFAKVTWTTGLDDSGKPVRVASANPSREGALVYPGVQGATNWFSPSYSPHTGLFYIDTWENYSSIFNKLPGDYVEGRRYTGGAPRSPVPSLRGTQTINRTEEEGYGVVRAFDPKTGVRKWEFKMADVTGSGVLTTASDLLFAGGREGYFWALDARTGAELWRANVGGPVDSGPMTYEVNGRQYVAVSAGNSLFTFALRPRPETKLEPDLATPHRKHLRLFALFVIAGAALAQQSRITKPVDNAQRVTLTGHVNPKATPANDRGRVAPTLKLSYVTLTLTPSTAQKADLTALLAEQQNPSSPNYHRWLTPAQYADRFGVSAEDMRSITQWLQGQGLAIVNVAQGRNWVAVSGEAAQIEAAFAIEIHQYAVDGETHFANATNPSVPAAIGGVVLSIRGLDDFRMKPRIQKPRASGGACGGASHCLAPNDLATIYDILPAYNAGIDGTGQTIVVAGQSDIVLSDIQNFQNAFNLTGPLPKTLLVPGTTDPGISPGDREESDLDLEWSGAVARNASITFVYSENVMDAVNYAIDQNLAKVLSVSYGLCEQETGQAQTLTFQTWAQKANAQGITWFDASGDDGAADCGDAQNPGLAVDTPASVPEVTGVGGTQFVDSGGTYWSSSGAALSYIPETSWNTSVADDEPAASGGGLSIFFTKPAWQVGPGVPGNNARNVPDVALNADPDNDGYVVYTDGNNAPQVFGGTSCPTPVMAGIAALLNQYLVSTGSQQTPGLGNINPQLYSLRQSNPTVFNDITTGNNDVTVTSGGGCTRHQTCNSDGVGYNAGVGYDNVTGLGSVNAWSLIKGWKGGAVIITPPPATASLSLVSNLSSIGQSDVAFLTATATADDGVSTPLGVVQFSAGGTSLGPVTLVGSGGISTVTLQLRGDALPAGSTTITATYNGNSSSAPVTSSVTLNVRAVGSSSNGTPVVQGLTDAASYQQRYAPGMIMSMWGANLASSGTAESAGALPLPVTIAGVAATVNGVAAPLYYVSPTQLNIQIPYQTAVGVPATLAVDNNGEVATRTFELGAESPGIFTDTTNTIVCGGCSAVRGQTTTLYMAGAGAVTPAIANGSAPALATPLASLPAPANTTLTVGGLKATTSFIGIPYFLAGVVQINFQIPSGISTGPQPVVVKVNGTSSVAAILNVTN